MTETKTIRKAAPKATTTDVHHEEGKPAAGAQKAIQQGAEKVAHAVDQVFVVLKTHFEKEKVNNWQKKWLAVPENRKKYEKLADAPVVVGEELVAVTNDIIDFIQGEDGSQSNIVKGLKDRFQPFFKHPVASLKQEANKAADVAKEKTKQQAVKATTMAKDATKKGMEKGMDLAKETAKKGAATVKETAEKTKPANGKMKKAEAKPAKK